MMTDKPEGCILMNRAEKRRKRSVAKKAGEKENTLRPMVPEPEDRSFLTVQKNINLGIHHLEAGRLPKAQAIFSQVLLENPINPIALNLSGVVSLQIGEKFKAVKLISKSLSIKPDYAEAYANLGDAYRSLNQLEKAIVSYQEAIAIQPEFVAAYNNLGISLRDIGRPEEAIDIYHKALAIRPNFPVTLINLGLALVDIGTPEEALDCYRKAISIKPEIAEAHYNLGHALQELGQLKNAAESYEKAIAINPGYGEAHRHLSRITSHIEYDASIQAMEQFFTNPAIRGWQRMNFAFGLGKAYEDLHQHEKAFKFYIEGNRIKRESYPYSITDDDDFFKKQEEVFDTCFYAQHQGAGFDDETPIFIVGMPRSGTTLIEHILASHPQVHGAGELKTLSRVISSHFGKSNGTEYPESLDAAGRGDFERAGAEYIRAIREHSSDIHKITDKMPGNFLYLGLIKLILPKAKVIHCCRNPVDTCLSLFKNYFIDGCRYAYDLRELGQYYNAYQGLIKHWHSVMPGFIYDIQYENMIADQATQTRALLDHCGLEWDDACLEFHETARVVKTASAAQVRKPIYNGSVGAWEPYEVQLSPLLEILG